MRKGVLSVVSVLILLAFYASAQTDEIALFYPKDGEVVNDCPSFRWSPFDTASTYTLMFTNGSYSFNKTTTKEFLDNPPTTLSDLWSIGSYSWKVVSNNGISSKTQTFTISLKSCLPTVVPNKINNAISSTNSRQKGFLGGGNRDDKIWLLEDEDGYSVSQESNFTLRPLPGGKLIALKLQETFAKVADEAKNATLTLKAKAGKGDNFISFQARYYSNGYSKVSIEVGDWMEGNDNTEVLGYIGGKKTDYYYPGWSSWEHVNDTSASPHLTDDVWENVSYVFTSQENHEYGLRFVYHRAPRTEGDEVPKGIQANFMLFIRAVTFGQCSSLTDDTYSTVYNERDRGGCYPCPSAGMYFTSEFITAQCQDCNDIADGSQCDSVSYCSLCRAEDNKCLDSDTSTCKEDAGCESRRSEQTCMPLSTNNDCVWCPLDNKCVYKDDDDQCTTCNQKEKSTCSGSYCHWCPVTMTCEDSSVVCHSCNSRAKPSCSLEDTDSECQWCNSKTKCMNVSEVCDAECKTLVKSACIKEDCQWCTSADECLENRISCSICTSLSEDECNDNNTYPGCKYCQYTGCQEKETQCLECSQMNEDQCNIYSEKCQYCTSTTKCNIKGVECRTCSSLSEKSCGGEFVGCSYCQSLQECVNSSAACYECTSMQQSTCLKYSKGCCYSTSEKHCYNIGNDKCDEGLDVVYIVLIVIGCVIVVLAAVLIPVIVCCCKKKKQEDVEMHTPGTIVVLPEGQPSMVVASESMQSVGLDPMATVSIEATGANDAAAAAAASVGPAPAASAQVTSSVSMSDMQNILAQQQLLNTMMAQQQMSMMMNPMMVNSMSMMGGMAGMSGMGMGGMPMNNMGMDMNSMAMTGGMNSMNSMNMGSVDQSGGQQPQ